VATCPTCGRRDRLTLDRTGDTALVARPLGTWSLAGAQLKTSAVSVEVMLLVCDPDRDGCGWTVRGYVSGGDLVALEAPTPSTTE
jgi:hypothetical protein